MTMKITIGDHVTTDRYGNTGCRVELLFDAGSGLSWMYQFGTHGLSDDEITAERDRIIDHHAMKAAKFQELAGISSGSEDYAITDCTVRDRGANVELVLRIEMADGTKVTLDQVYGSIADVPALADVRKQASDGAVLRQGGKQKEQQIVTGVKTLLGVR